MKSPCHALDGAQRTALQMKNVRMASWLFALSLTSFALLSPLAAHAHVTLAQSSATAGSYYKAVLKVGHGCAGAPTTQIKAQMPQGVLSVKPMNKPGWTVTTVTGSYDKPVELHGKTVAEGVKEVIWTAKSKDDYLADDRYDEFAFQAKLPAQTGSIWFKVNQICTQGSNPWVEVPAEGQDAHALKFPAAQLNIKAADPHAGH